MPSGSLYISQSALAPTPDRVLLKRMREYDKNLGLRWSHKKKRWIVTSADLKAAGRRIDVITVETPEGKYQPLDNRVLMKIREADALSDENTARLKALWAENERAMRANQAKRNSDRNREGGKDMWRQMFGSPYVAPKGGWGINAD